MKFITNRQEIAEATNLMKYPVILMNIGKPKEGWEDPAYGGVYEGDMVRVDEERIYSGIQMYADCTAMIYVDNYHEGIPDTIENRLKADIYLESGCTCLHSSFGAEDVLDAVKRAQAPVVKAGQIVTVVYKDDSGDDLRVYVRKMKVSKVTPHYATVAKLIDYEEEN